MAKKPYNKGQRPEAALQTANDFIAIGGDMHAMDALYKTLKFHKEKEWTPNQETAMMKYLDLFIKLRNSSLAKDALHQYRNLTQQNAVHSLKKVVETYLDFAEKRVEEAKKEANEIGENVEDLDVVNSPETLLLALVSGDCSQDRRDQAVFVPWLRFLWESYRNCLEMLRNNVFVKEIYQDVVRKAFMFCANYKRRFEFNKMCDILRVHLDQIRKNKDLKPDDYRIDIENPKSLALIRKTREIQLDTAIQMEHWQESYKSVEALHSSMGMVHESAIEPSSFLKYYDNLAKILLKGGNNLFHAAALLKKFKVYKGMEECTDEETSEQATQLILATLSILQNFPMGPTVLAEQLELEGQHWENVQNLSDLLRLKDFPKRADLFKELESLNILELAAEPIRKIYKMLEIEFSPLRLASKIEAELNKFDREEYSQYAEDLKLVAATRALIQLATVYDSLSFDRLMKIIPFYNRFEFENFLIQSIKQRSVNARIDHYGSRVRFNELDFNLARNTETKFEIGVEFSGIECVRVHFDLLHSQLRDIVSALDSRDIKQFGPNELQTAAQKYLRFKESGHKFVLENCDAIEKHKEKLENERQEKFKQREDEKAKCEKQKIDEQNQREIAEQRAQEAKRLKAKEDAIEEKKKDEKFLSLQQECQQIIKMHGEEAVKNMDPEEIQKRQRELMKAEKLEIQKMLRQQEKDFDYMIRADFLEESRYYKQMSEEFHSTAKERHSKSEENRVERETKEHELAVKQYEDLSVVSEQVTDFLKRRLEVHVEDLEKLKSKWVKKCKREKVKRLADRKVQRKVQREKDVKKAAREAKEAEKARLEFEKREATNIARKEYYEMIQRVRARENAGKTYVPPSRRQLKPRATNANATPMPTTILRGQQGQKSVSTPTKGSYVPPAKRQSKPIQTQKPPTPAKTHGIQRPIVRSEKPAISVKAQPRLETPTISSRYVPLVVFQKRLESREYVPPSKPPSKVTQPKKSVPMNVQQYLKSQGYVPATKRQRNALRIGKTPPVPLYQRLGVQPYVHAGRIWRNSLIGREHMTASYLAKLREQEIARVFNATKDVEHSLEKKEKRKTAERDSKNGILQIFREKAHEQRERERRKNGVKLAYRRRNQD